MQTCNNIIISNCVPVDCSYNGRGIEEIDSNNDGHPVRTEFTSGAVHIDEWDGVGQHLSTTYMRDGATAGKRWYTGDGHVVRGGVDTDTLEMARFEGGFFDRLGAPFFYVTDYRGSVTAVLSSTGSVLQRIDYYPYGEPWIEPQPYTDRLKRTVYNKYAFGGKERLTADGINEYDQDARRYAASFPLFTTPDQHASNTPWLSPYIFCGSNPVMNVDPTGKDIYTFNDEGKCISREENTENDIIKIEGSDAELTLEYGTIKDLSDDKKTNEGHGYLEFSVYKDSTGKGIFEFLAENTSVEWSHLMTGVDDNGLNYLTTSHEKSQERGAGVLINNGIGNLRRMVHNHPGGSPYPSGFSDRGEIVSGDMLNALKINKDFLKCTLAIYTKELKKYIEYTRESTVHDFPALDKIYKDRKRIQMEHDIYTH